MSEYWSRNMHFEMVIEVGVFLINKTRKLNAYGLCNLKGTF